MNVNVIAIFAEIVLSEYLNNYNTDHYGNVNF